MELPGDEATALGQLLKRIDRDACVRLMDPHAAYDDRSECDVAWAARDMVLRRLAEAGLMPGGLPEPSRSSHYSG
jgi:hypothetical protein